MATSANMTEHVYERILQRADRAELSAQCRDVAQREAKLIQRRVRGARRVLQHALDVDAARGRLSETASVAAAATPATAALVDEIERIQRKISRRMRALAARVAAGPVVAAREAEEEETAKTKTEPEEVEAGEKPVEEEPQRMGEEKEEDDGEKGTPVKRKGKKRRLSRESVESPRKPPRPGRLAVAEEEDWAEGVGPHVISSNAEDDETEEEEEEEPVELELLDADTEFHSATYLEKARRLRKISSERRMSELPGLIRSVLAEVKRLQWEKLPRELLGTLSATMGAATTLKPEQRQQIHSELNQLRAVAMKIDERTARKYPTLNGSKARFLSSIEDLPHEDHEAISAPTEAPAADVAENPVAIPPVYCENIEALCTATEELAARADGSEEPHSMEEVEELLTVVEHVFDNPTTARSDKYCGMVAAALVTLIAYVQAIPRNTRRRQQCEQTLTQHLAWLMPDLARGRLRVRV